MRNSKSSVYGIILLIIGASGIGFGAFSFINFKVIGESDGPLRVNRLDVINQPPVYLEPRGDVTIPLGWALGFPYAIFDEHYEGTWLFTIVYEETQEIVYANQGNWEDFGHNPRPNGYEMDLYGGVYVFDKVGTYGIQMIVEDVWGYFSFDNAFVIVVDGDYEEVEIKLQVKALVAGEWENPNGKLISKKFYKVETKIVSALYDPETQTIVDLDELAIDVFESEVMRKHQNTNLRDFILGNYEIIRITYEIV